jgi:hypothetical protein
MPSFFSSIVRRPGRLRYRASQLCVVTSASAIGWRAFDVAAWRRDEWTMREFSARI